MTKIGSLLNTAADFGREAAKKKLWQTPNIGQTVSTGVTALSPFITGGNHTALGDIGMGLGTAVSTINPWVGAAITGVSALGNAAFGSNVNEQAVDDYNRQINNLNTAQFNARSNTDLLNQFASVPTININRNNLGTQGWFSHKVDNIYDNLQNNNVAAMAGLNYKKSLAASNVDKLNDALVSANYAAFGGPLFDFGDGAIAYDMAKDSFIAKQLANQNKNMTQVPNALGFGGPRFPIGLKFPIYDNGIITVGAGGTHGENPFGGVLMGIAPDGQPNLVEEGEVIYNDYVYSNRLKVPKALRDKYNLKKGTFADAMNHYFKKNGVEERPNDPIMKNGLMAFASDLAMSQEEIKMRKEMKQMGLMADGGPIKSSGESWEEVFQHEILRETVPGYPNMYPTTPKLKAQARRALRDERERRKAIDYNNKVKNSGVYRFLDNLDNKYLDDSFIHPEDPTEPISRLIPNFGYKKSPIKGVNLNMMEGLEELNQSYASGGHLFPDGGLSNVGDVDQRYNNAWSDYVMPSVEEIFNRALDNYNMAETEEDRQAARELFMNMVNGLQESYSGIANSKLGTKNDAIGAHQKLFDSLGGNAHFSGDETIPGIDNIITQNYTGLTKDSGVGNYTPDSIFGHRTALRHFGATGDVDAAANARLAEIAAKMGLGWNPNDKWTFGEGDNARQLYALSERPREPRSFEGIPAITNTARNTLLGRGPEGLVDTRPVEGRRQAALASLLDNEEPIVAGGRSPFRNAGLIANLVGLGYNIFDPYRPGVIDEIGPFNPITASPIGDYVDRYHTDTNYIGNQLAQEAAATRNAIMQSTLPSRIGGLLTADYNAQVARGNAIRDAGIADYETNLKGSEFNRGTNQYNSQLGLNVAQANMQGFLNNAAQRMQQRAYNVNYDFQDKMARDQAMGQSLTAIGDWFDALRREGVAERGLGVFASTMPQGNRATDEYIGLFGRNGGLLTKSKRRK